MLFHAVICMTLRNPVVLGSQRVARKPLLSLRSAYNMLQTMAGKPERAVAWGSLVVLRTFNTRTALVLIHGFTSAPRALYECRTCTARK